MRKIAVVLIPLLVLVLIAGAVGCCTKTVYVTPTPTPTMAPTPTPTEASPATPTPTVAPTPTPLKTPPPPAEPPQGGPPCRFHGTVVLNGTAAPAGTQVTVIVEGYGYPATVTAAVGSTTYSVIIPVAQGINYEGKIVTFMIGDDMASQTSSWTTGGNVAVNISATT